MSRHLHAPPCPLGRYWSLTGYTDLHVPHSNAILQSSYMFSNTFRLVSHAVILWIFFIPVMSMSALGIGFAHWKPTCKQTCDQHPLNLQGWIQKVLISTSTDFQSSSLPIKPCRKDKAYLLYCRKSLSNLSLIVAFFFFNPVVFFPRPSGFFCRLWFEQKCSCEVWFRWRNFKIETNDICKNESNTQFSFHVLCNLN